MTSQYSAVIFASAALTDEAFSKLRQSCNEALCLQIGIEISAVAADFFCDCGPVMRFDLLTSPVTGDTHIHDTTAIRVHANAEDFEALSENEIYLFNHEEN